VSSKVVIKWDIVSSVVLTDEQKDIVLNKLVNQINSEGFLVVSSQETRDQIKNRKIARDKLNEMINEVLKPQEERKPTKISKAKKDRRVEQNRREGKKKADRRGGKNIKDW